MKRSLVLLTAFVLLTIGCRNSSESTKKTVLSSEVDSRGYIVKVGDTSPDFTINYLDGSTQLLSELRGKVVMIQFTASWCGVCRKEMPHIENEIWKKHSANNEFSLIGIDYKESVETTAKFAKDMNITYPLTLDEDGEIFNKFCGPDAGVTRNIILDREGKIIMLTRLFDEEEFAEMVKLIDSELNKTSNK
jgi:peroxiredoxin